MFRLPTPGNFRRAGRLRAGRGHARLRTLGTSMPALALVTVIRNEARFLPAFLAYYRALGVDRAFVYLDRCTDASRAILQRHDWVEAVGCDQDPGAAHLVLHQMQCAKDALERARAGGYDWLLLVDVDEFAWGGRMLPPARPWWRRASRARVEALLRQGSLAGLVSRVGPEIEMITLRTVEVVPEPSSGGKPFWSLYNFQVESVLGRPVLDPTTGQVRMLERWVGHRLGKSLVRTRADVQPFDSHVWTRNQRVLVPEEQPLNTVALGWLLHYVVTDGRHWRQKYRQLAYESNRWLRGQPVDFPKQAWKEASCVMDAAAAGAYFDRWVAVSRFRRWVARVRGGLRRVTAVGEIMEHLGLKEG